MHTLAPRETLALPFYDITLAAKKPRDPAYPRELKTIGDHLRKRRLDLNLLQKDVAKQIGADTTSLWAWETNRKEPALRFYPSIIEFLGYHPLESGNESLAQEIKRHRYLHGLSQEQLAAMLQVDPGTVSDWEAGRIRPSEKNRHRLELFLAAAYVDSRQADRLLE